MLVNNEMSECTYMQDISGYRAWLLVRTTSYYLLEPSNTRCHTSLESPREKKVPEEVLCWVVTEYLINQGLSHMLKYTPNPLKYKMSYIVRFLICSTLSQIRLKIQTLITITWYANLCKSKGSLESQIYTFYCFPKEK